MSEMATIFGRESQTVTKVTQYKWTVKDAQGIVKSLSKTILQIHSDYQRHQNRGKVLSIASAWSWVACGVIVVGKRDNEYWVIDGQHRVAAANMRADIIVLPCIVFDTVSISQEAKGFLDLNTGRKPVSSIDKFRASKVSGDATAIYVDSLFLKLGITPAQSGKLKPGQIKSVAWSLRKASENKEIFEEVLTLANDMCTTIGLQERLLDGLFYIRSNMGEFDGRIIKRIRQIGAERLLDAANRAAAYYSRGGAKVWADGMLTEINKGLRSKIIIEKDN